MKRIVYTKPDGNLAVVTPVINTFPSPENMTEDEALARALSKLPAGAVNPVVVEEAAIPTDRAYRDAWSVSGNSVIHDMTKAREIHKNKLRELRATKFPKLDIDYMRADEAGNNALKIQIAQQKQSLRDVTADPRIAAAQTPEELKLVIPEILI